jgi:hypothetical protein
MCGEDLPYRGASTSKPSTSGLDLNRPTRNAGSEQLHIELCNNSITNQGLQRLPPALFPQDGLATRVRQYRFAYPMRVRFRQPGGRSGSSNYSSRSTPVFHNLIKVARTLVYLWEESLQLTRAVRQLPASLAIA